jgi:hypothetical protein
MTIFGSGRTINAIITMTTATVMRCEISELLLPDPAIGVARRNFTIFTTCSTVVVNKVRTYQQVNQYTEN